MSRLDRLRRLSLAVSCGVASLLLVSCGGGSSSSAPSQPATFTITGEIQTVGYPDYNGDTQSAGKACTPSKSGLMLDRQVLVMDNKGVKVAVGQAEDGRWEQQDRPLFCVYPFTVENVPEGSPLYSIQIGDGQEVTYSREDLKSPVALSLI